MPEESRGSAPGIDFNGLLLVAVILLTAVSVGIGTALYLSPEGGFEIPENQQAVRIAEEEDFPIGTSRIQDWGSLILLVVRRDEGEYFALQGTSPTDGCILRWDARSLSVVSPCGHLVYDLHGNVVAGLTTRPLNRYSVFVRGGVVYVTNTFAERSS